jgi:TonB dependent receptor-like, beta-barrel/CarboxypepD_reg-like domain/TonB-dependent Receptor Plug Domain
MYPKWLFIFLLSITPVFVLSQNKYTLSGYIRDSLTGETLIGATVSVIGKSAGIASNQYGFYSLTLPRGTYKFVCTYVGYLSKTIEVDLNHDVELNFELSPKVITEKAVVVNARRGDANVKTAQMGKIDLSINQIKEIPAFMGEIDIMKTIQLLPGIQNAGEASPGLYVRGGGPDQNLIMLDDAVVYNSGHLFGFFSIFNGDAIKSATLIKGGMPAQYGGRLSSVLDISMKEGNDKNYQFEGGIGLIASRISVQGPIKKNKASFILSARRTYIDALVKPFIKKSSSFYGSGYYFYDLNAKMNYMFSDKNRLYLSGYFGKDKFDFVNGQQSLKVSIPWGNSTATVRWNHVYNHQLFSNTSLVYNDYKFNFGATQNDFQLNLFSGIRDWNIKEDFDWYPSSKHKVKFGALYTYHTFIPNVVSGNQDSVKFDPNNAQQKYAREGALYLQDDWDFSNKLRISTGIRESGFQQVGPYKSYVNDENGNHLDSTSYSKGQPVITYLGFEPRFTIRYTINDAMSLKASVTRNFQYIHLVSNAGTTLPTDLWVPSTLKVKPQESWLYSLGLFKNYNDNMYETSLEVYYKLMKNQIEYQQGYTPATLEDTEDFFTFGKGWSYGAEFYINKKQGRLTGWIGYTLSWTFRRFAGLNNGYKYYAKYDRRHDLSVVAIYDLSKKWKLSGTFVFGSGNAATLPQRFYIIQGVLTQEYSAINAYRLPPYDRLDLAVTYRPNKHPQKKVKSEWVFSAYNVYNRKNPYFIYFDQTGNPYNGTLNVQAKQVSIFPIIPSVTWNFKF